MKCIAVLMTCYNRVDVTLACLARLFSQAMPPQVTLEVWLVDDASPDGTGVKVTAEFPQVHVIHGPGKLFWCKGMRLAWDEAIKYEILSGNPYTHFLWLNDDVMLKEGALTGLLADCEATQGVVVGTFSRDETESEVSYGATRTMPDGMPRPGEQGMNGNLVLIPRTIYEKVGPICGGYHHQYGDYDYGFQLRKNGLEFYSSSRFCGVCPEQPERYFHLKDRSLVDRWKLLFNPKGYSLHDAFLYSLRNKGFLRALMTVAHVCVIVTFALEKRK